MLSAVLLFWLGQATDVDRAFAALSYDAARAQFPLRDHWIASQFFHVYLKRLLIAVACAFIACAVFDLLRPAAYWSRGTGWRLRTVAACAIAIPACVALLKRSSRLHCPWDIAQFGGSEPYFRLLDMIPASAPAGHCFPAGHASSGLWLASIMIFWLPGKPATAWRIGAGLFCVGMMMGLVQQLRGAHFLTHTLWTAWIAATILYAAYGVLRLAERRALRRTGDDRCVPVLSATAGAGPLRTHLEAAEQESVLATARRA
ncbi:MAG: phosphatase PAP2 family protein [Pseudomonadota bacterium]